MKATKITYYATTGLMSLAMAFSTFAYLSNPALKEALQHLGFPDYFRIELGIAKGLAAIALWLPFRLVKEVAYIGLSITFISACIAHIAVGDPTSKIAYPLIFWVILVVSYVTYNKLSNNAVGKSE
jgi:hypothetical protein